MSKVATHRRMRWSQSTQRAEELDSSTKSTVCGEPSEVLFALRISKSPTSFFRLLFTDALSPVSVATHTAATRPSAAESQRSAVSEPPCVQLPILKLFNYFHSFKNQLITVPIKIIKPVNCRTPLVEERAKWMDWLMLLEYGVGTTRGRYFVFAYHSKVERSHDASSTYLGRAPPNRGARTLALRWFLVAWACQRVQARRG